MCDGMKHDNCEKMSYPKDEEDKNMEKHEDEEMGAHDDEEKDKMGAHDDEEKDKMGAHDDEEKDKMGAHDDEEKDKMDKHYDDEEKMGKHDDEKEKMDKHYDDEEKMGEHDDEKEKMGLSSTKNNIDGAGGKFEKQKTQYANQESQKRKEANAVSLTSGEREELNALRQEVSEYRRIKKISLVDSFKEDLSRSFIDELISKIDKYTLEEIEVSLSKEFTRISKQEKQQGSKFKPLAYSGQNNNISASESKTDIVKRLVDQLK
jgi:hypothetical protein